jgi:putative hemolysin
VIPSVIVAIVVGEGSDGGPLMGASWIGDKGGTVSMTTLVDDSGREEWELIASDDETYDDDSREPVPSNDADIAVDVRVTSSVCCVMNDGRLGDEFDGEAGRVGYECALPTGEGKTCDEWRLCIIAGGGTDR